MVFFWGGPNPIFLETARKFSSNVSRLIPQAAEDQDSGALGQPELRPEPIIFFVDFSTLGAWVASGDRFFFSQKPATVTEENSNLAI